MADITTLWKEFRTRQDAQREKNKQSRKLAILLAVWEERNKRWFFKPGFGEQIGQAIRERNIEQFGLYAEHIEDMLDWVADGKPGPKDIDAK